MPRVTETATQYRFYGELAEWWPLLFSPEQYVDDAAMVVRLLEAAAGPVRDVLDLGSGGGHLAVHLKDRYDLTLVDLSEQMLEMSRRLNPGCEHQQGDMRSVRLDRTFDAVLVHEAVAYMITEDDLRRAIETAFVHCRPGGTAIFAPDTIRERFEPWTDHGGTDAPDGRGARFLDWTWDPDPDDTWIATEYAFVLREADGTVRVANETHRCGLFGRDQWLDLLGRAGFEATAVTGEAHGDRMPEELFVALRPDA